jgi:hypothetical protein
MDKEQMSALLGRPLTPVEDANYKTYLKIARESLDSLLCMRLCDDEETKYYDVREGYSTVFTDVFTEVEEVKLDGKVVSSDNYSVRQWDRRNGSWYNAIVFDCRFSERDKEVEVTADWGFYSMPADLQAVLAGLFSQVTKKNTYDGTIASKQVEDYRISFRADADLDTDFMQKYGDTLAKYSICKVGYVKHGRKC